MRTKETTEQLLLQCEQDLLELKAIKKKISAIEERRASLASYYKTSYQYDYEAHTNSENHYRILDQDSIWNVLQDQYALKIELIKSLAKSL